MSDLPDDEAINELEKALDQKEQRIRELETENKRLKDTLSGMTTAYENLEMELMTLEQSDG